MRRIKIEKRFVGEGEPAFIIAEAGTNHNGKLKTALKFIKVAKEIGADAVKFQSFKAETLASKRYVPKMFDTLRKYTLKPEWHLKLKKYADKVGIIFLSTPFDEEAADLLDEIGVAVFKIASGDLTNTVLLRYVSRKKKPIMLSTGGSELNEIKDAVNIIKGQKNNKIILMHCISSYPTKPEDANVKALVNLKDTFNLPVGYSDHSPGSLIPIASVSLGACVIEKHLTFDRKLKGPDHSFALEVDEFKEMVKSIRILEKAMSDGMKHRLGVEKREVDLARRSIVTARHILSGTVIKEDMIKLLRPGIGIPPKYLNRVIGRRSKVDIPEDKMISWKMLY